MPFIYKFARVLTWRGRERARPPGELVLERELAFEGAAWVFAVQQALSCCRGGRIVCNLPLDVLFFLMTLLRTKTFGV